MASFLQGYRLCRSCHGDWFSAEKLPFFSPSSTVSQLYFGASVCEDHLHGLLCFRLGHFPLLLSAERRRHRRRRSGMDVSRQEGRSRKGGNRLLGADGPATGLRRADPEMVGSLLASTWLHQVLWNAVSSLTLLSRRELEQW